MQPTTPTTPYSPRQRILLFAWDTLLLALLALSILIGTLVVSFFWYAILSTLSAEQVLGLCAALALTVLAVAWVKVLLSVRDGAGRRLVLAIAGSSSPSSSVTQDLSLPMTSAGPRSRVLAVSGKLGLDDLDATVDAVPSLKS